MRYRHLIAFVSPEESDSIEGMSWNEGFTNLYFEEIEGSVTSLHVLLEEGEELPAFLREIEFSDLGFSEERDWFQKWKETLVPFSLCDGFEVIPLEEEKTVGSGKIGIIPGMAFGTGLHESTRLAAAILSETVKECSRVLDVGCGTGILSVIAARKGAKSVIALDIDEHCIEKTIETARINEVSIEVRVSDFLSAVNPGERFDLIVSNMIAELLMKFVLDLRSFLTAEGTVILSGIYKDKYLEVENLVKEEFSIENVREDGDWKSITLKRK
ncbi:MAG: 50S ribosomal protein L11 methyltransferase [Kosmotogaceae bacterium]|nr:50S ribosomal protein L11 methyltransferase [Kosmotogaceae bacterium]